MGVVRRIPAGALRPARLRPLAGRRRCRSTTRGTSPRSSTSSASPERRSSAGSMGGRIALELAIARPELVAALVLVGAGVPGIDWSDEVEGQLAGRGRGGNARRPRRGDRGQPAHVGRRAAPYARRRRRGGEGGGAGDAAGGARAPGSGVGRRSTRSSSWRTSAAGFGEVRAPTLVLVGEEDVDDIRAAAERLAREIPGATSATIARAAARCRTSSGRPTSTRSCSTFSRRSSA